MVQTHYSVLERIAKAFRKYVEFPNADESEAKHDAWLELCFAIDAADAGGADGHGAWCGGVLADPGVPMILHCPMCNKRHIDKGEFAHKAHHTHACQKCGHVWRPAIVATKGVRYLPGFKND